MTFDVEKRTILRVRHGSHAYGLNIATSDIDEKGVCIEPLEYHLGFLNNFEQFERMASKGGDKDLVIYAFKKFVKLAAECNPNIIEVLFVDDSDILYCDKFGEELLARRNLFISKEAFNRFSGYARGQLHRIKSHRSWLMDPPKNPPNQSSMSKEEFKSALTRWNQYENWKKQRNPARAELEAKFGFDTKHGMHLIRLMRMCKEIMTDGSVNVKRQDRDELLAIRNGERSYDSVVEEANRLDQENVDLHKISTLPEKANRIQLDKFVVETIQLYLSEFG